jgi:hypothetical protein
MSFRGHGRRTGAASRQKFVALAIVAIALAATGFMAGTTAPAATPDPVQTRAGVPIGVEHTPAGAVAAADEYVATEQATVERDPARFAALVSKDYVASVRAGSLAAGRDDRLRDPAGMKLSASGGESFTTVAAHRLDWYRSSAAQVTTWAGQVFWGPHQPPSQVWALGRTDLIWRNGRWEVSGMSTLPTPAPAPAALPQDGPTDDTAADFYARLNGFVAVSYGSPH